MVSVRVWWGVWMRDKTREIQIREVVPERIIGLMGGATQQAVNKAGTRKGGWLAGRLRAELCEGLVVEGMGREDYRAALVLRVRKLSDRLDRVLRMELGGGGSTVRGRGRPRTCTIGGICRFLGVGGSDEIREVVRRYLRCLLERLGVANPPLTQVRIVCGWRTEVEEVVSSEGFDRMVRSVSRWVRRRERAIGLFG